MGMIRGIFLWVRVEGWERTGSRGGGRGSDRKNGRSWNKGSANAGTSRGSEGSEGSNNPPAYKQTIPQTEYDKVKGNVSVAWNPSTCGTSARLESPRLRRGRLTGVHRCRTTAVILCAVLRMLCLVVVMTDVLWNVGMA